MRVGSWMACMAIVVVAAGAGAANASAEVLANESVPFAGSVPSLCPGFPELIAVEGTMHTKTAGSVSQDGDTKSQIETNITGVQGIGMLTLKKYVMNVQSSEMAHTEADPEGGMQATTQQTLILTRQGETGALLTGDDFRLHVIIHLTQNSNGVPTAGKVDLGEEQPCR